MPVRDIKGIKGREGEKEMEREQNRRRPERQVGSEEGVWEKKREKR